MFFSHIKFLYEVFPVLKYLMVNEIIAFIPLAFKEKRYQELLLERQHMIVIEKDGHLFRIGVK